LDNEQLWEAVEEGNERAVKQILQDKGDPNYKKTYNGIKDTSLLILASILGYRSIAQLLLEHGAKVNDTNTFGETALHYASLCEWHEVVQQLVESQAEVDAVDVVSVVMQISNYWFVCL
jgi:ankyrin repeat protein